MRILLPFSWCRDLLNIKYKNCAPDVEHGENEYSISLLNPNGGLSLIKDLGLVPQLEQNGLLSNGFRILEGSSGKILFDFTKSLVRINNTAFNNN